VDFREPAPDAGAGGDPAPVGGDPAPVGGDPAPVGGNPGPSGGNPGPSGGDPGPSGGNPGPSGGDPGPSGGDPGPSGGDPGPSGGDPGPSGGDPGPSGGDPGPSGGDPGPSGGDPGPVGGDPGPVGGAEPPVRESHRVAGEISGRLCGDITVDGQATVPAGETLTLCAGARVVMEGGPNAILRVAGALVTEGTVDAPVLIEAEVWAGMQVGGRFEAMHTRISGAENCLVGLQGSVIVTENLHLSRCVTTMNLANGGDFRFLTALGGSSIRIGGGALNLIDSVVDLQRPVVGPDCLVFARGGATIEHSHLTGCHCPLHVNAADLPVVVTDSILDGASYPVMLANLQATFHLNHLSGTADDFLDIGGQITADIADNYYDGGPPAVNSGNRGQFSGIDAWRNAPVPGVGPR
jgi:hypothetical protein